LLQITVFVVPKETHACRQLFNFVKSEAVSNNSSFWHGFVSRGALLAVLAGCEWCSVWVAELPASMRGDVGCVADTGQYVS
jgi:hypothetical protein